MIPRRSLGIHGDLKEKKYSLITGFPRDRSLSQIWNLAQELVEISTNTNRPIRPLNAEPPLNARADPIASLLNRLLRHQF